MRGYGAYLHIHGDKLLVAWFSLEMDARDWHQDITAKTYEGYYTIEPLEFAQAATPPKVL